MKCSNVFQLGMGYDHTRLQTFQAIAGVCGYTRYQRAKTRRLKIGKMLRKLFQSCDSHFNTIVIAYMRILYMQMPGSTHAICL